MWRNDGQVIEALEDLFHRLRSGCLRFGVGETYSEEPWVMDTPSGMMPALVAASWHELFEKTRPYSRSDLIGILRKLYFSVEMWTSQDRGESGYSDRIGEFLAELDQQRRDAVADRVLNLPSLSNVAYELDEEEDEDV